MPLRLKSLELHGYKTFAVRTVFEFAAGITAIVGPNGAGKSNIADAMRWVLGEQSYSLLRGKKTEDMIFSGSEHRPRAGMASAEILFDNSANWLPLDFAEVGMTRRAYRDGHNEYLLNGQHVRLRDMNELLAASGLSERTYTIVGQGLVDASLALKADERRRLFEEAAGVGLYRVRREEALKRLENTQRNLERVQDIMTEIEPRLKTLERQARRANEYAAAQMDLRAVLREWYGYHWHHAQQELQEAQESVRTFQAKAQAAREILEKSQARYSEFRGRAMQLRAQLNSWHRELADLQRERDAVSLDLAVLDERRRTLAASQTALSLDQQSGSSREQLIRGRLGEIEQELNAAQADLEQASKQSLAAQQALQARHQDRGGIEGQLQAAREKVVNLSAQRAQAQARFDALVARLDFHDERIEAARRAIETAQLDAANAAAALAQAKERAQESDQDLQNRLAQLEAARNALVEQEERRRIGLDHGASLSSSHSKVRAQLEVIEQAEQTLSGYADGARFLLDASRQSRLKSRGALSAMLDLPAELESAIAAALGDAVDAVLIDADELEQALQLLESEDAGRAVLLPVDGRLGQLIEPPNDGDVIGLAAELVKAPADLRPAVDILLGSTMIVRTRMAARRLVSTLPPHARIVTLGGEVFRGDGLITAGKAATTSTLSRPRQKRELLTALEDLDRRLRAHEADLEKSSQELQSAQVAVARGAEELEKARLRSQESQALVQQATLDAERQMRLLEWHQSRHAEFIRERAEVEAEKEQLAAAAAEYESIAGGARNEVRRLTDELSQLSLDEAQEQAAYWGTRAAVTEQRTKSIQLRRAEHEETAERLRREAQEIQARLSAAQGAQEQLETEKAAILEQELTLKRKIESLQAKIAPAEEDLTDGESAETGLDETETAAQKGATSAERQLTQYEIELVRRQEALESLQTRVVDDFGLVSFEYASSIEGPVPLPFEGLVEELPDVSAMRPDLEEQLQQRRARLRRLGLINPEAAKEYDAEAERYSFMSAQVQDLHQAQDDLRQVISELDDLTRQEFSRTYAAVDRQFRAIFARLFGGGAAHLELTDPDNLVETGIEIEARLPGRREQGLSLLSGGERSLTAIALVFALLKVSPTPVCVMDEVDAMLDEANVGRFRDLLKELSQDTQFIIITHNRNTVQAADFIYGVTMGRDSTSQIISLKLDEVSEEMLGTGRA